MATADPDNFIGSDGADWVSYAGSTAAGVAVNLDIPTYNLGWAAGDTLTSIQNIIGTNQKDFLGGNGEANTLRGGSGDDNFNGGAGADTLYGGDGKDYILGQTDADTLYGGDGKDYLSGGAGDDQLYGGAGEDTYRFNGGGGTDTIHDMAGDTMTLQFHGSASAYEAADFLQASNNFKRVGNNLEIIIDDKITIIDAYDTDITTGTGNSAFTINIEFGNGTYIEVANEFWHGLTA